MPARHSLCLLVIKATKIKSMSYFATAATQLRAGTVCLQLLFKNLLQWTATRGEGLTSAERVQLFFKAKQTHNGSCRFIHRLLYSLYLHAKLPLMHLFVHIITSLRSAVFCPCLSSPWWTAPAQTPWCARIVFKRGFRTSDTRMC